MLKISRIRLERVTDVVVALLGDGRLAMLPGGVEEYLQRRAAAADGPGVAASPAAASGTGSVSGQGTAGAAPLSAADARAARKEMLRWERVLARLDREREEADLHAGMVAAAADYPALAALDTRLRALTVQRAGAEDAWLSAAESAEGVDGSGPPSAVPP